jgi:hypothetical protein
MDGRIVFNTCKIVSTMSDQATRQPARFTSNERKRLRGLETEGSSVDFQLPGSPTRAVLLSARSGVEVPTYQLTQLPNPSVPLLPPFLCVEGLVVAYRSGVLS